MQEFDDFDSAQVLCSGALCSSELCCIPSSHGEHERSSVCLTAKTFSSIFSSLSLRPFIFYFFFLFSSSYVLSPLSLLSFLSSLTLLFFFFIFLSYSSSTTLPHLFSSFFPTNRQTGRRERSVQSGVLVSITCLWRTDPGRQLCSCRVNPELRLSGNCAPPLGRSRLRALTLRLLLLQNHLPPLRLLLLPPSHRGWCSSWQHQ